MKKLNIKSLSDYEFTDIHAINGMSNDEYHSNFNWINTSWLNKSFDSLHHFLMYPRTPKKDPSDTLILGSAVHTYLLENNLFDAEYRIFDPKKLPYPDSTMGKKENKDYMESLKAQGKPILSLNSMQQILDMTEAPMKDPLVKKFISGGVQEESIFFYDEASGLGLKVRPDSRRRTNKGMIVLDVKTTQVASPKEFAKSVTKYKYDVQAAMQCDGISEVYGEEVILYLYLAIEKEFPYSYCLYELEESDIEIGRMKYRNELQKIKAAIESDYFPSYGATYNEDGNNSNIVRLKLPAWHYSGS